MKLFILGLIILLILVCQIYKIIKEKDHKIDEDKNIENMTDDEENTLDEQENAMSADDFNSFLNHRKEFNKETIRYYHELMEGKLDTQLDKAIGTDFLYLDGKNRLIFDNYDAYMKTKSFEGFHGGKKIEETGKEINKCRAIKECGMLDLPGYENCGYCGDLGDPYNQKGKFEYMPTAMGGKKIGTDVCPSNAKELYPPKGASEGKPLGNRWATTSYDCEKIKLQDKCSTVENCNELNDADGNKNGLGALCGWCPADKAYPRDNEFGILYDKDNTVNPNAKFSSSEGSRNTQVKGDRCDAFYETYNDENGKLKTYFDKLQKAADCSICDNSGGQFVGEDNIPRHSDACLQDLWSAPVMGQGTLSSKVKIQCSTNFDSTPANDEGGIYYKNYGDKIIDDNNNSRFIGGWGYNKWYKVRNDMRQAITYPLYNFKKDYNTKKSEKETRLLWSYGDKREDLYDEIDEDVRRGYIMNNDLEGKASKYRKSKHEYPDIKIDKIWKQCFNKTNERNYLKCVPSRELENAKDIIIGNGKLKRSDYLDALTNCETKKGSYECLSSEIAHPNGSGPIVQCREV